jgi:hypothetical protein
MNEYIAEQGEESFAVKIAVGRSIGRFGYQVIWRENEFENSTDISRISEWMELTFIPRAAEEIVPEMISKLDQEIQQTRVDHEKQISRLIERRRDLAALTLQSPPLAPMEDDGIPL